MISLWRKYQLELVCAIVCLGLSVLISGYLIPASPDQWYWSLRKANFHPPGYIFGPVWTILYLMMGAAFGCFLKDVESNSRLIKVFIAQFILNVLWPPTFFLMKRMDLAFILLSIIILMVSFMIYKTHDKKAQILLLPYLLWLCFAWILNAGLLYLN